MIKLFPCALVSALLFFAGNAAASCEGQYNLPRGAFELTYSAGRLNELNFGGDVFRIERDRETGEVLGVVESDGKLTVLDKKPLSIDERNRVRVIRGADAKSGNLTKRGLTPSLVDCNWDNVALMISQLPPVSVEGTVHTVPTVGFWDVALQPLQPVQVGDSSPVPPTTPQEKQRVCSERKRTCDAETEWFYDREIQACNKAIEILRSERESFWGRLKVALAAAACTAAAEAHKKSMAEKCLFQQASCLAS